MIDFIIMYILVFAMVCVWTTFFWFPKNQEKIIKGLNDPEHTKFRDVIPAMIILAMLIGLTIIFIFGLIISMVSIVFKRG